MSNFFENFPLVNYTFGDEGIRSIFQNISAYTDIFQALIDDDTQYETYWVRDIDRPDTLSYELYDTPEFYWTFYLLNPDIIRKGWPNISSEKLIELKNDLFPDYSFQIKYDPNFLNDLAPWVNFYGDSGTIEFYDSIANKPAINSFFNVIRPGSVIQGNSGTGETGVGTAVVTSIDYNHGIINFKPWNGLHQIYVYDGGSGYDVPPEVIIEGTGSGAYAEAIVDSDGAVSEVRVYKPGYGYTPWPFNGTFEPWRWNSGAVYGPIGNFGQVSPAMHNDVIDFLKAQSTSTWWQDSDLFFQYESLRKTKVKFKRNSAQKGRDAIAFARVNDIRTLQGTTTLNVYNLVDDYRNWDWRKYPGTYGDNYDLFGYFGAYGSFSNNSISKGKFDDVISINATAVPSAVTYTELSTAPDPPGFYYIMNADGTVDLRSDLGYSSVYEGEGNRYRYIPEQFMDYSRRDYQVLDTNTVLGTLYGDGGGAFVSPWARYDFFPFRNESIYNVTQAYYEVPVYDPEWTWKVLGYDYNVLPFTPNPNGTVRLNISDDGVTNCTVSGLTGNPGDLYYIKLKMGNKYGADPWSNPATSIAHQGDMLHHWEDSQENRVFFNLFDSNNSIYWYDYRAARLDSGGYPYTRGFPMARGNYEIVGQDLVRVSNFQNLERQLEDMKSIKVLKPDSVRKIANAFKKAIRGTNR